MRFRVKASAIGLALLWASLPGAARASEEFPGALQEAAGMPCAPQCALCHGVTPGTATTFTAKKLPRDLITAAPGAAPHNTTWLKAAYTAYAMNTANADAVAKLKEGKDPETGDALCGPTYGCGARFAKPAPQDGSTAPYWVAGALLLGSLLRRRKLERP